MTDKRKRGAKFNAFKEKLNTNGELSVYEFTQELKKKGEFENSADGFKVTVTVDELRPDAQELINEVGLNPLSPNFFKNTRAIKPSSYWNYVFARGKFKC